MHKIFTFFSFCLILGSLSTQLHAENRLPDLGARDLVEYDEQTEKELGEAFITSLHTQFKLIDDYEVVDYVRQIGHKVAAYSGQNRSFRFYVIDNPTINAFAGPNGVIGIHSGLIEAVSNEAELASVIAHEIAHITQQHLSRRYLYQTSKGNATSIATLLAAILIGMVDPSAGMATLMSGQSLAIQNQLKNSRQHEKEADFVGIKILHDAGYNAFAMADFFGRLAEESRNQTHQIPEILRTHPVTESRLVQAHNRATSMIPMRPIKESEPLKLVQLRIKYLKKNNNSFEKLASRNSLSAEQSCYELNLIELNKSNPSKKHLQCLQATATEKLEHSLYNNLLLERLQQLNYQKPENRILLEEQTNESLKLASFHQELHPDQQATNFRASELLMSLGKSNRAIDWILNSNQNTSYQYQRKNLIADFYNRNNQVILAYIYQAYAQMNIFNKKRAKHFIEQAEKLSQANNKQYMTEITKFLINYEDSFEKER